MMFVAFIFSLALSSALAQYPVETCKPIQVVKDFNHTAFLGLWFQYSKYQTFWETFANCLYEEYSLNDDGTYKVLSSGTSWFTGQNFTYEGIARHISDPKEANFSIKYENLKAAIPVQIIGTDYENYAVVYSCNDYWGFLGDAGIILTRIKKPSQEVLDAAYAALERSSLVSTILMKVPQCEK